MTNKPKIRPNLSATDKTIELIGWIVVLGIWILPLYYYSGLPESIPIHYNGAGEVDSFGGRASIFILPTISTILFIALTILNKYPHVFNYPVPITEENALSQYTKATRMLRFLKLVIVLILGLILYRTIQNVNGNANGLGAWILPLIIALIFVPIAYYLIKSMRK